MKVATFLLLTTSHSHFLIPKICGLMWIFMSSRTLTWQPNLQWFCCSFLLKKPVSVGSIVPPPSRTWQRHMPQLPPPPHADGRNICSLANVASNELPGSTSISFSSLILIFTLPCGASFFLTITNIVTGIKTTTKNTAILNKIIDVVLISFSFFTVTY